MNTADLIKRFEGYRSRPYQCPAGVATIGYGSTHYEGNVPVTMFDKAIDEARATELLEYDLQGIYTAMDCILDVTITDNQRSALASFIYNLGLTNFINSTLCKKIKANANDPDIAKEFAKWVNSKGRKLAGLVNRRKVESDLYFTAD